MYIASVLNMHMKIFKFIYYKSSNLIHIYDIVILCYSSHSTVVMYDACSSYKRDLRLFELFSIT